MNLSRTQKAAFTLIELLVVIAIIALLLSIVMPALRLAKGKARTMVCAAHVRNMQLAWHEYAIDNDSRIPSANTLRPQTKSSWADWPIDADGSYLPVANIKGVGEVEDRIRGIKNGVMYPYIGSGSPDIYNCPSDKRKKEQLAYRSYSIQNNMNGISYPPNSENENIVKQDAKIRIPSQRIVFLEETDQRGINMGSWYFPHVVDGNWGDPLAMWHNSSTNFSFADGHAENKKWVDDSTKEMGVKQTNGISPDYANGEGEDYQWMYCAY